MIKWYFVVIFIVFLSLHVAVYAAGIPLIFSYQGRLTNASGSLLTGTYYFKFSIWDDPTSNPSTGNKLWPICSGCPHSVSATVASGVFNVNIGDTANGFLDTLDYNFNTNKDIYLQVEASSNDSDFEPLSPRQRISSAVFAQLSGAVSGTGQSSFGTTTPISNAIVTVEATTTFAIPVVIRGALGQVANLFRIEDSSSNFLFKVDVGTTTLAGRFNVLDADTYPQFRLGHSNSIYGEFYTDPVGDIKISSTGGNIRANDQNLWVCEGDACNVGDPADTGNIIVETAVIFNNNFKLKYVDASTTVMYNATGTPILQFDEGQ